MRQLHTCVLLVIVMPHTKAKVPNMPPCPSMTSAGNPCPHKCQVVDIKGRRYKLKTCLMHSSDAIKDAVGVLNPPRGKVGRKKKQTVSQVLRQRVEAEVERYLQPLEDALLAMRAVVVGNGGSAHIEMVEDLNTRIKAVETILDRIYGRPRQTVEHSGPEGDSISVTVPNDEERKQALAAVLASTGALGHTIPQNPSASAPSTN